MRQLINLTSCLLLILAVAQLSAAQKPELVVQTGHSDPVSSIVFSPDGRTLASRSEDGEIKLWDFSTGTMLRTLAGSGAGSVAFSPDGKTIANGNTDGTVMVWVVSTGAALHTLNASGWIPHVLFSPDGKVLASQSNDLTRNDFLFRPSDFPTNITRAGVVKLWDAVTGAELCALEGHSFAFSPDSKTLATGSSDNTVRLWDVPTGRELRTLTGHSAVVTSIAFSADGGVLAGSVLNSSVFPLPEGVPIGVIKLWDVSNGAELRTLEGVSFVFSREGKTIAWESGFTFNPDGKTAPTGTIKLLNIATGTERSITADYLLDPVAFSPDGKMIIGGVGTSGGALRFWDTSTGAEVRTIAGTGGNSVIFSPDWKTLASSSGNTITLWDTATGTGLRTLTGHSPRIYSLAISPDGKTIANSVGGGIDGRVGYIRLWDVTGNAEVRTIINTGWITSLAFSPDGKILAGGISEWHGMIKFWDVSTGAELGTYGPIDSVTGFTIAYSPDGKTFAAGSTDKTIKLWDRSTGAVSHTLTGHAGTVTSVAFSPDGKILASGSASLVLKRGEALNGSVKLWDVSTGTELRTLKSGLDTVYSVALSPDGGTLAAGSADDTIRLWDVSTGAELHAFTVDSIYRIASSVAFSPDGKILAGAGGNYAIKLWDVSTGRQLGTLATNSPVLHIGFSSKNNYLISGNDDSSNKIWDVNSGKELISLVSFDEQDWLVTTPDGLFDGSPATWNQLLWRFNNDTFDNAPVEAFYNEFYYPGLLTDISAGKRPKAPTDISQKDRRQPHLKLTLADAQPNTTFTVRAMRVKINVSQAPAGVQDVRLFRNGSLVKFWQGDVLRGRNSTTLETTLPVVAGENKLSAYAFNHDNIKSSDVSLSVNGAEGLRRAGTLYIVAVGVGRYANADYNLNYTPADAQAFGNEMLIQQELLQRAGVSRYGQVKVITLLDRDATKANILRSLRRLAGADTGELPEGGPPGLAELRVSQPEDGVLIYFSGHGTAQGNHFYIIPHDMGYMGSRLKVSDIGLRIILARSISDAELEQEVRRIDARQLLLVIDACNSGQVLQADDWRRGPMNTKGLAQLAYEKGMYVLTASQSVELAFESDALKHSYMTYALVEEGLKSRVNEADSNKDGQLWLREWFDYAVRRVPQMSEEKIAQTIRQQGKSFDLIEIADRGKVQTPRAFYRKEPDAQPWVVARTRPQVK
jgi:WD40 repeat protein/uncharacterized caspase-like protein